MSRSPLFPRDPAPRPFRGWRALLVALLLGVGPFAARPCLATPISSVAILPPAPTEADAVTLRADLLFATAGHTVDSFATSFPATAQILVDIFVTSPAPGDIVAQVLQPETVNALLGQLPAADYTYTVRLFETPRGTSSTTLTDSVSGSFSVVPEPGTLTLAACGALGAFGLRRRAARRIPA